MSHDAEGLDWQIFLVGTAHVSRSSAEEVRELIRVVQPTTVMVELCEQRAERLRSSAQVGCSTTSRLPQINCAGDVSCELR